MVYLLSVTSPAANTGKSRIPLATASLLLFAALSNAHGGHSENIPEGEAISVDPIDGILWGHILLMIIAFGLVYPAGMVLGMVRSRWHVPVQIGGTVIATVAYFMGHMHKGRQFAHPNIHASFANSVVLMVIVQVGLGVYLKMHLEERIGGKFGARWEGGLTRWRSVLVAVHGWLGKLLPVVAWVQMLFGGIVAMGFCRADHLGQCLAHFIMGSAFIGYGIVMTMLLMVGQGWLRRTGRSQEFFDSILIAAWGCVNTFTEHRWGSSWSKNDLQHTAMGIVWWCAGLLGVWLSRNRSGRTRRNVIPGVVIIMTGWAMSAHPQALELSNMVHKAFGWTLIGAGATRIIEISFLLRDSRGGEPSSWQHLPPFLLYASGFLFMGATEEQMQLLQDSNVTHVAYILVLYSISFLLYLLVQILLHIYAVHAWPDDESNGRRPNRSISRSASVAGPGILKSYSDEANTDAEGKATSNGSLQIPKKAGRSGENQQIRDAEEFELEGLMSDAEEVTSPNDLHRSDSALDV